MIFFLSGCKDFGVPDFELKIEFGEGVIGTPTAGTYNHKELTEIDYSYEALDSQYRVEVVANGNRWLSEGSFIMYTDMEIVVRIIDIRGDWAFVLVEDDVDDLEFVVTFTGNSLLSGEFTDDRGYRGTWSIDGVNLTMNYDNWLGYELFGYIDSMDGTWERAGYTGTWSAGRIEEE
jgi:hypothetical protein